MRRSGVSGLCHRPDEAVASNRVTRRLPVDRLVFLTATCPSLHILRSDAGPGQGTRLSANPATISRTYSDMSHFYVQMLSLSHRRRRYEIGARWGGAPVGWARPRRGGRLGGAGGGGSGRPRPCRPSRSLRSPPRGNRRRGPGPGARGSRYVLAGYPTSSWTRPGRDDWAGDWGGARDGPGAGRPISGRGGPSPAQVGPRSAWRRTAPRRARQGLQRLQELRRLQGSACVMRAQRNTIHPTSRRASSA